MTGPANMKSLTQRRALCHSCPHSPHAPVEENPVWQQSSVWHNPGSGTAPCSEIKCLRDFCGQLFQLFLLVCWIFKHRITQEVYIALQQRRHKLECNFPVASKPRSYPKHWYPYVIRHTHKIVDYLNYAQQQLILEEKSLPPTFRVQNLRARSIWPSMPLHGTNP